MHFHIRCIKKHLKLKIPFFWPHFKLIRCTHAHMHTAITCIDWERRASEREIWREMKKWLNWERKPNQTLREKWMAFDSSNQYCWRAAIAKCCSFDFNSIIWASILMFLFLKTFKCRLPIPQMKSQTCFALSCVNQISHVRAMIYTHGSQVRSFMFLRTCSGV